MCMSAGVRITISVTVVNNNSDVNQCDLAHRHTTHHIGSCSTVRIDAMCSVRAASNEKKGEPKKKWK